jgi:hypothetical protein
MAGSASAQLNEGYQIAHQLRSQEVHGRRVGVFGVHHRHFLADLERLESHGPLSAGTEEKTQRPSTSAAAVVWKNLPMASLGEREERLALLDDIRCELPSAAGADVPR